jgi:phospholipase/lecithinase/hemolysin
VRFLIALVVFLLALLWAAAAAATPPLEPFPIWTVFGQSASHYGESVTGAGDVNSDGFDDVAVGASRLK